jgi:membrane-associated phospholipid phosphatase
MFLGALYAWRLGTLRWTMTTLWGLTWFASVYLNHHYIVDGLCGMALAGAVFAAAELVARRRARRENQTL